MQTRAYKLEILIVDTDDVGLEGVKEAIELARYPNHCISPQIKKIEMRQIGEWSDEHPLNKVETAQAEYERLFGNSGTIGIPIRAGWYFWKNPQGRIMRKEVFWGEEDGELVTTAANGWIIGLEDIGGDWLKMFE